MVRWIVICSYDIIPVIYIIFLKLFNEISKWMQYNIKKKAVKNHTYSMYVKKYIHKKRLEEKIKIVKSYFWEVWFSSFLFSYVLTFSYLKNTNQFISQYFLLHCRLLVKKLYFLHSGALPQKPAQFWSKIGAPKC